MRLRVAVKLAKRQVRGEGPYRADAFRRILSAGIERRIRTWRALNRLQGLSRMSAEDIATALTSRERAL